MGAADQEAIEMNDAAMALAFSKNISGEGAAAESKNLIDLEAGDAANKRAL